VVKKESSGDAQEKLAKSREQWRRQYHLVPKGSQANKKAAKSPADEEVASGEVIGFEVGHHPGIFEDSTIPSNGRVSAGTCVWLSEPQENPLLFLSR
jgi:hypothetical protein